MNVRQTLDSSLVKKYFLDRDRNAFDSDQFEPRQIFQAMQLDPFKDIASLTLVGSGLPELNKGLLILRGNFDLKTIATVGDTEAQRAPDTLKIHKESDKFLVYEFRSPRDRSEPLFLCFLDKGTAVLSPACATVADAIAKKMGKQQASMSKEMQALLNRVDTRQTVWLAGLATESLKKELGNNPQTKKLVGGLRDIHGGLTVGDGVNADFLIQFGDARAAGDVRKFLIGMQSLVELAVLGGEWSRKVDDVLKKHSSLPPTRTACEFRSGRARRRLRRFCRRNRRRGSERRAGDTFVYLFANHACTTRRALPCSPSKMRSSSGSNCTSSFSSD